MAKKLFVVLGKYYAEKVIEAECVDEALEIYDDVMWSTGDCELEEVSIESEYKDTPKNRAILERNGRKIEKADE